MKTSFFNVSRTPAPCSPLGLSRCRSATWTNAFFGVRERVTVWLRGTCLPEAILTPRGPVAPRGWSAKSALHPAELAEDSRAAVGDDPRLERGLRHGDLHRTLHSVLSLLETTLDWKEDYDSSDEDAAEISTSIPVGDDPRLERGLRPTRFFVKANSLAVVGDDPRLERGLRRPLVVKIRTVEPSVGDDPRLERGLRLLHRGGQITTVPPRRLETTLDWKEDYDVTWSVCTVT